MYQHKDPQSINPQEMDDSMFERWIVLQIAFIRREIEARKSKTAAMIDVDETLLSIQVSINKMQGLIPD